MTIGTGDSGNTAAGTTVATSGAINVSVGDFVAIIVSANNGPRTVTGITDNSPSGNTWTPDASNPQVITGMNTYVFTSVITSAKTGLIITAALSGSTAAAISAVQVTGRSGTPILVRAASIEPSRVSSHTSSATGTIVVGDDVICLCADTAFFDVGANETYTATGTPTLVAGATQAGAGANPTTYIFGVSGVGSTASQIATWTNNTGTIQAASVIMALSPSSGGSTAYVLTLSPGAYSYIGMPSFSAFGIDLADGQYAYVGQPVTLIGPTTANFTISLAVGNYNYTGKALGLIGPTTSTFSLPLGTGVYEYFGFATLFIQGPPTAPGQPITSRTGQRVVLPGKKAGDELWFPVDFLSKLNDNETIVSGQVRIWVYAGFDPNPQAMVVTPAVVSGTQLQQFVTGGVLGVTYGLLYQALTTEGETIGIAGYLTIMPDLA